ncbi:hypothetical protein LJR071_003554 [Pseudomonas sp. LjRoot71]|uniref:hypothetical protein n=1 Tax=Pseudomonas sp. LjRoot71 TaxID=3342336 RepID=UPI003ECDC5CA
MMIPGIVAQRRQVSEGGDPFWANVVFLSHFDGADGSTIFVDQKGHPITRSGSVELDTANKKFGSASALFAGGYLNCPSGVDYDGFGASNAWTIEGFCLVPAGPTNWTYGLASITQVAAGLHAGVHIQEYGGLHYIYIYRQGETNGYMGTITFPRGTFNYIKICNTGSGSPICYVNGAAVTLSSFGYGTRLRPAVGGLVIGGIPGLSSAITLNLIGQLDEVRLTRGVARTDSYAVPLEPFPNN